MSFKPLIKIGLAAGLVLLTFLAILVADLPRIAEMGIHFKFGDLIRDHDMEFRINGIGMSRTGISGLRWGEDILIDHAEIEYSLGWPGSIPNFLSLKKVTLSGMSVHAQVDSSNHLIIHGLSDVEPRERQKPGTISGNPEKGFSEILPLLPTRLILKNSRLYLTLRDRQVMVPIEVRASLDKEKKTADLASDAWPFGDRIQVTAGLDLKRLNNKAMDLDSLLQSFRMDALGFDLNQVLPLLNTADSSILFSRDCDIRVTKKAGSDWALSLAGLNMVRPQSLGLDTLAADFHLEGNRLDVNTRCHLICTDINGIRLKKPASSSKEPEFQPIPVSGQLRLDLGGTKGPAWNLAMETSTLKGVDLDQGTEKIFLKDPFMALEVKGDTEKINGSFVFRSTGLAADLAGKKIRTQALKFESSLEGSVGTRGPDSGLTLDFRSRASQVSLEIPEGNTHFKAVEARGVLNLDKEGSPGIAGTVSLVNGRASLTKPGIQCKGINVRLPFQTHPRGKVQKGDFNIDSIRYAKQPEVRLSGKMEQVGPMALEYTGNLTCPAFTEFNLPFSGAADLENQVYARADFTLMPFRLLSDRVKSLIPKAAGNMDFSFDLSGQGFVIYQGQALQTQAKVIIQDGSVFLRDMNLKANGIQTSLEFNDLVTPESLPGQMLTIDSIESGKFRFKDARIRFSIEDGKFIQIENARAGWCNGLVSTESVRFPSRDGQNLLILYCDRLELARLLEQVGAFQAKGEGTLSGRIPVTYSNGDFSFDNGFLFSAPGTGGTIQIQNTDKITAGIPMDNPQFGHLDLAREALKDFAYTWAKLNFNTTEDDLNLKMELDGQPSDILPFEYKKDIGSFVRVEAGSPGSHFQGIKLDVNLKLPFNQVMKFGKQLKSIFKN